MMQRSSDELEVGLRVGRLLALKLIRLQFTSKALIPVDEDPHQLLHACWLLSHIRTSPAVSGRLRSPHQQHETTPLAAQRRGIHGSARTTACQSFRRWKLRARGWRREPRVVSLLNRESNRHNTMLSRAESQKISALRLCIRGTIRLSTPVPLTPILCGFFPNRQCYSTLRQSAAEQLR